MCDVCVETSELVTVCVSVMCVCCIERWRKSITIIYSM